MSESEAERPREAYERAAISAREAASRARDAADAYEALAEQLLAGNVEKAGDAHQKAAASFAQAAEAAQTCDDWLTKSGDPS